MATKASSATTQRFTIGAPVYTMTALALIGCAVYFFLQHQSAQQRVPAKPLSAEAKAYVRNLELSGVQMRATENYVNQMVIEIEGKISNKGNRAIGQLDVYCVFHDSYGQVVLREKSPIVRGGSGGLKPAESKSFRLPFDNLPESWNRNMPQLVIAQVIFS